MTIIPSGNLVGRTRFELVTNGLKGHRQILVNQHLMRKDVPQNSTNPASDYLWSRKLMGKLRNILSLCIYVEAPLVTQSFLFIFSSSPAAFILWLKVQCHAHMPDAKRSSEVFVRML